MEVRAYTHAGEGAVAKQIIFTQEEGMYNRKVEKQLHFNARCSTDNVFLCIAPSKAPMITSLFRVDAQTANLSWEFLTLEELRGFLYTYEVVYFTTIKDIQCSDAQPELNNTQSAETNNILITDLDPEMEYCVGVAASTVVGVGNYSYEYLPCKFQHVCTHTCLYKRINPPYNFTQYSHMRKNLLRFQLLP